MKKHQIGNSILVVLLVVFIAAFFVSEPIVQDKSYHLFSDKNTLLSIPNFWNVLSNLAFFFVGLLGVYKLATSQLTVINRNKIAYYIFFSSVILVSVGSGYYHLNPNNETLVWDRLPMTVAFMALFAIVIAEFLDEHTGRKILVYLIQLGLFSIGFWLWSPSNDLRLYAMVQFYPMLAIPVILLCYTPKYTHVNAYWFLLLFYLLAKIFEQFDEQIFEIMGFVSGHSLKHIAAAVGIYLLLRGYGIRTEKRTD